MVEEGDLRRDLASTFSVDDEIDLDVGFGRASVDLRLAVTVASPTQVLKPLDTVGVVTPNRGIDADFLSLPRHELADAALAAATAAGATHADLRIHRLVNEIIQLRDGELETAVVNREIGLAVRVVVDGTWGFASHAELSPEVAADRVGADQIAVRSKYQVVVPGSMSTP